MKIYEESYGKLKKKKNWGKVRKVRGKMRKAMRKLKKKGNVRKVMRKMKKSYSNIFMKF